jgi:protein transport protein SEC13
VLCATAAAVTACLLSCQVFAWTEQADGSWRSKLVHNFKMPVWKLSWSVAGNILAVSDGNNAVTLWKETLDGVWQQVQQ